MLVKRPLAIACLGLLSAALVVACASGPPDCVLAPDPCPEALDLAVYCGSDRCTASGEPVDCTSSLCRLTPPITGLTIPVAQIAADLRGRDLRLEAANGCDRSQFAASLDGQSSDITDVAGYSLFRWDPFPSNPQVLELTYASSEVTPCSLGLRFVDGDCLLEHWDDCFQ